MSNANPDSNQTRSVVLIDDEIGAHQLVRLILMRNRPDLVFNSADNGLDGLELVSRVKPDLILLDIMMPVLDGIEVLRRLKADPGLCNIPVIMHTARTDMQAIMLCLLLGAADYLTLPYTISDLVSTIDRFLMHVDYRAPQQPTVQGWLGEAYSDLFAVYARPSYVIWSGRLFCRSKSVARARITLQAKAVTVREAFQEFEDLISKAMKQIRMIPPYLAYKFLNTGSGSETVNWVRESYQESWTGLGELQSLDTRQFIASVVPPIRDYAARIQTLFLAIDADPGIGDLHITVSDDDYLHAVHRVPYSTGCWDPGDSYEKSLDKHEEYESNHGAELWPKMLRDGSVKDLTSRTLEQLTQHLVVIDRLLDYANSPEE